MRTSRLRLVVAHLVALPNRLVVQILFTRPLLNKTPVLKG
jgi:hypothetical protein